MAGSGFTSEFPLWMHQVGRWARGLTVPWLLWLAPPETGAAGEEEAVAATASSSSGPELHSDRVREAATRQIKVGVAPAG